MFHSILDLVGKTPLLQAHRYGLHEELQANLLLKLECFNPLSSVKDRIGLSMVTDAMKRGVLNSETVIIEPTSGNTGIALAYVCAALGFKLVLTMPETMSQERRKIIQAFGAELVLTEGSKGMRGAILKAQELQESLPNSIILGQFENPANPQIHRETTALEILTDCEGCVDALVAGVGTGGTITGVGEVLRQHNPNVKIFAVEPSDSPVLSGGIAGPHKIQGIGAGFVPKVLNTSIYDEVLTATYQQAQSASVLLAKTEGVLVGVSSGAALHCATQLAKQKEWTGKNIVVILPDTGERYLSTPLFD